MKNGITLLVLLLSSIVGLSQTFDYKDSGTGFILYDLSIPPGASDTAYATGSQFTVQSPSVIIKTTDAGETWETIYPTSGTIEGLERIVFLNDQKGFAVVVDIGRYRHRIVLRSRRSDTAGLPGRNSAPRLRAERAGLQR